MDTLNDDELLIIFKLLTLNERTKLRSVSKRFKSLLDSIKITKLIIYDQVQPIADQLTYTNEPYDLLDTVEVYDLYHFFNNATILKQMESIRILTIEFYLPARAIDLKTTVFTKLSYLKLRNVEFTNPSILKSTELEHLILESSFFNSMSSNRMPTIFNNPFNHLNSPKIKYLMLTPIDFKLLANYFMKRFDSIIEIDIMVDDCGPLTILNGSFCSSLKTINCHISTSVDGFLREAVMIEQISQHLRDDLSVYLFGTYDQQVLIQQFLSD